MGTTPAQEGMILINAKSRVCFFSFYPIVWGGWGSPLSGFDPTTRRPKVNAQPGLGAQASSHLVSILPALSNEIWPALEENWIMGPSINTIFPPLKLHTWWKVVRCHVLKLLPNSLALIYCAWCSWLLKTVVALSILTAARLTPFFTLTKRQNYFQSTLDFI